jgi:hypothetical protein
VVKLILFKHKHLLVFLKESLSHRNFVRFSPSSSFKIPVLDKCQVKRVAFAESGAELFGQTACAHIIHIHEVVI